MSLKKSYKEMNEKELSYKLSELENKLTKLCQEESNITLGRYSNRQDLEVAWEDLMEQQDELKNRISTIKRELNYVNTN